MKSRLHLKLKPLSADDADSRRIFDITRKTIEDFNGYVGDFYGTIAILKESMEVPGAGKSPGEIEMVNRDIEYMENKIAELSVAMRKIATDMSFLVEVEEAVPGEGKRDKDSGS